MHTDTSCQIGKWILTDETDDPKFLGLDIERIIP